MSRAKLALTEEERRRYADDGFFARERVFGEADLERLRSAAERVAAAAKQAALAKADAVSRAEAAEGDDYRIDGNRYVEAADATVQYEHGEATASTIRVIEPFHHLDPVFDDLRRGPPPRGAALRRPRRGARSPSGPTRST